MRNKQQAGMARGFDNSRKSVRMVRGTNCPYVSVCRCEVVRRPVALKDPMTYVIVVGLPEAYIFRSSEGPEEFER